MHVRVNDDKRVRRLTWFEPCEPAALDTLLRTACSIDPARPFLLLESTTMAAVAISGSLPSALTFELVRAGARI